MTASRPPLKLGLLPVAVFVIFGTIAALVVPTNYSDPRPTPPDEACHAGYVIWLARHHTLPVFLSANDNYEAHQPPLYYLSALPSLAVQELLSGQTATEATYGPVVALRLWSVLVAAAGVWLAWLLGRRVFAQSRFLALAPALLLALWPGRTLILSAVTNDGLAEALCLLTFLLCAVIVEEGLTTRRAAWLGLSWALALMSKSTSLALAPVVLLAVVMAVSRREQSDEERATATRQALTALAIIAAVVVVVAGWWFVRNQIIYGDPLAAAVFNRLFKVDRATPEYFFKLGLSGGAYFSLVVMNTALSFWGVYGQANVWSPAWYYLLGFLVWLLVLAGLVRQRVRPVEVGEGSPEPSPARSGGKRSPRRAQESPSVAAPDWRRQVWTLAWILLVVVVVFFLRFNTEFYQAQARYLFTANGPLALLTVLGLWDVGRRRAGQWAVALALVVVLAMALWSVCGYGALVAAHYPPPFVGSM
ncbi:glycosyltransferase family 39 protein [bacterium]|nr:glycosyltransferase family 39 protein [bacterium]